MDPEKLLLDERFTRDIANIDPMERDALSQIARVISPEEGSTVFPFSRTEEYVKILGEVAGILKEIIDPGVSKTKMEIQAMLVKKAELIGHLPEAYGVRKKVAEITQIDGMESLDGII